MTANPFDTLGLPPRFDLDPAAIQRAHLARSAAAHADEAAAAQLNTARITLEDPEKRATALLARLGGPSKESDRSLPDGFLMEMMEVREQIDSAKSDPAAIDRWDHWGEQRRQSHITRATELFAQASASIPPPREALLALRRELNAWRYIERMLEQLHESDQ